MTGSKLSRRQKTKNQKGQALIFILLVITSFVSLITFFITFRSSTEIELTKLEEENLKAMAAAQAGIEAALKQGNVIIGSDILTGSGISGQATTQKITSNQFISPLVKRGEQYTFYLSNPRIINDQPDFSDLTPAYNNKALTICSTSNSSGLEITLIKRTSSGYQVKRWAVNPPSTVMIDNAPEANNLGQCPDGESFAFKHQLASGEIGNDNLLLIVRVLVQNTRLGLRAQPGAELPSQGITITSEATTEGGGRKVIELFQSYPQIPAELFNTSF